MKKEIEFEVIFNATTPLLGRYMRDSEYEERIKFNLGHRALKRRDEKGIIERFIGVCNHEVLHGAIIDCIAVGFKGFNEEKDCNIIDVIREHMSSSEGDEFIIARLLGYKNDETWKNFIRH